MSKQRLLAYAIAALIATASAVLRAETVGLESAGGTFRVPVVLNGQITLKFTLDSGAADVSIPADVFSTLMRTGTILKSDLLESQTYQLADGSETTAKRFKIRSLRLGSVELRNVTASVSPPAGELLLGQSFLKRLESWGVDNRASLLIINEPVASLGARAPERAEEVAKSASTAPSTSPKHCIDMKTGAHVVCDWHDPP